MAIFGPKFKAGQTVEYRVPSKKLLKRDVWKLAKVVSVKDGIVTLKVGDKKLTKGVSEVRK
jgi:hypothetical protein